jgi:sterol desaturase/sphingolipid hydroxylase (fatty acid hydroxylase superfamily)
MNSEATVRLTVFISIFAVMAIWEFLQPARTTLLSRSIRWRSNVAIVVIGALMSRIVLPGALVGVALWSESINLGLFYTLSLPLWVTITISVLLLDIVIYWQHRWFHRIPLLWRLHKVHHADSHVDTTTGLRFHPIEIVLSLFIKALVVAVLGVPAIAVVIFEVALNGFAIFNHANIRLPRKLDDVVGKVLVTQRLHRIHHSQRWQESNSNFGFSVTWWDKLFGSYTHEASKDDSRILIGQKDYPASKKNASLLTLLCLPFHKSKQTKRKPIHK